MASVTWPLDRMFCTCAVSIGMPARSRTVLRSRWMAGLDIERVRAGMSRTGAVKRVGPPSLRTERTSGVGCCADATEVAKTKPRVPKTASFFRSLHKLIAYLLAGCAEQAFQ